MLAVVAIVWTSYAENFVPADRPLDSGGYTLVAAAALALAVRRRWPLMTLALTATFASAYLIVGYVYGPILVVLLVAVYTVARWRPLTTALPAALIVLAGLLSHLFTNSAALPGLLGIVPGSAWVVVPFAVGTTVRLAKDSAARARAEVVRQGIAGERLRMAQEVHDIVGHGLAAIKMQADVALHLLPKRPEQAEAALNAISRTSSEALDELRATLGVVRRTDGRIMTSPSPGLDRLEELRQRMIDAGVDVEIDVTGEPRPVPAAVDLTGYRIVQESLTNVLRHGVEKVARVRIVYETAAVILAVSNPAVTVRSPSDRPEGGYGIPGMRRRVHALGGEFSAGLTAEEVFEVRATLPTAEPVSPTPPDRASAPAQGRVSGPAQGRASTEETT
nr:histidine kinase [Actinopolymorpha alba]